MRTQAIRPSATGEPCLEHYPLPGGQAERTPLVSFPFAIGRNASCDLQIESVRVSREHALILFDGRSYRVRDLGSTNGTFLNGKQVADEAPLADGDILLIADREFSFFHKSAAASRQTATQVIGDLSDAVDAQPARLLRRGLRQLQE